MSQRTTLLEGSLDDIDLANVVQTVSVSRRSVVLELREPDGTVFGTLVLKAGQIVSVASEGLSGVDALRKLVAARRSGRFLVYRASGVDLRENLGPVADVLSSVLAAPGPGGPDAPGVLAHGSLDKIQLRAVLEALSVSRLSVTLELFGTDGTRRGVLALKGGQVLSASAGGDAGLLAARALLEAPAAGRFVVRAARAPVTEPLFSVQTLLRPPAREEGVLEVADEDIAEADADDAPVSQVAARPAPSQAPPIRSRPPPLPSQPPPGKRAASASVPPRPSAPPVALRGDAAGPGPASALPAPMPPLPAPAARDIGPWPLASPALPGAVVPSVPARFASAQPEAAAREIAAAKTEPRAFAPWLDGAPDPEDEEPHLLLQPKAPRSAPPAKVEPAAAHSAPAAKVDAAARPSAPPAKVEPAAPPSAPPAKVEPAAPPSAAPAKVDAAARPSAAPAKVDAAALPSAPPAKVEPAPLPSAPLTTKVAPAAPPSGAEAKVEPAVRRSAPVQASRAQLGAALPPQRVNGDSHKRHTPGLASPVAPRDAKHASGPELASAAQPGAALQAREGSIDSLPAPTPGIPSEAEPAAAPRPATSQTVAPDAAQAEPQRLAPDAAQAEAEEAHSDPAQGAAVRADPAQEPSSATPQSAASQAGAGEPSPASAASAASRAARPTADRAQDVPAPAARVRRSERPAAPPARAEGARETGSDATITARHPALRSGAPIVAVTSPKGGAGRSTLALNLAVSLARRGRRVVLVDADASNLLPALDLADRAFKGMADALEGWAPLADTVLETRMPGLKLVPSGELTEETYRHPGWLPLLADLARQADLVLVDCAPGWYGATLSVLEAATHQLLVLSAEPAARRICGAYQARLQKLLKGKHKPELLGLVINMLDYQVHASVRALEELSTSEYARHVLDVPIPRSPAFMEASARGVPIVHVEQGASSTIAWVFETLATALLERLQLERPALATAPLLA